MRDSSVLIFLQFFIHCCGYLCSNPRISNQEMETKMDDRRFIKLHMLANYLSKGDITGDWVTMGVVVKKLLPKTAANVS